MFDIIDRIDCGVIIKSILKCFDSIYLKIIYIIVIFMFFFYFICIKIYIDKNESV